MRIRSVVLLFEYYVVNNITTLCCKVQALDLMTFGQLTGFEGGFAGLLFTVM